VSFFELFQHYTCSVERYWHCSDETVHYKSDETVIFAVLDVQLRRL